METEVKFNLQSYLSEMRTEQRADTLMLSEKIDDVKGTLAKHDNRISTVENTRRLLVWLGASLGVAAIGFLLDLLANHFKGGQ
jgi:uncharacterized membrane protein YidH (DUF202 family)